MFCPKETKLIVTSHWQNRDILKVVYNCFFEELVRQRRTDMTSFCMQFEKRELRLQREAFRSEGECFVGPKRGGGKKKVYSEINSLCRKAEHRIKKKPLVETTSLQEVNIGVLFSFSHFSFGQKSTSPHSGKPPAITHVPFFKLHAKWRHVDASLFDQFPQKTTVFFLIGSPLFLLFTSTICSR